MIIEFDITKHKNLAAIDIGTNSFHLVVAEILDINRFKVLAKDKEVVRLGSGSKDMKYLEKEAIKRGIKALKRFKIICDNHHAVIRAVATSATREAMNRNEFISTVFEETGIKIEVVSGYEEARLIYLGALQALPVYKKKILLVDIGGGSTEFIIGKEGNIEFGQSIKVGAVRLTNKYFQNGIVKQKSVDDAKSFVRSSINPIIRAIGNEKYDAVVGTSGTITNIGQMVIENNYCKGGDVDSMNNFRYTAEALSKVSKKVLRVVDAHERKEIPGLDPRRADIIPAGVIILEQIFNELKLQSITISNFALREGVILDTIQKAVGTDSLGHLSDVRYKSVMTLARQTNFEENHSLLVSKLSLRIFDALRERYNMTLEEREYIEAAAVLHDIGYYISHSSHHKHSYYLIRNSEMLGFNFTEIEIIANVARYHRKSHPKPKHEGYFKLDEQSKRTTRRLSGILRVADSLDRGHQSKVSGLDISLSKDVLKLKPTIDKNENLDLEIWGVNRRKKLFEEEFGLKIEIDTN